MSAPPRLGRWQQPWQRWLARRHPPSDQQELRQRTIYVLPTRAGWFLALTVLLLLLASINFQLNLGYLLTFWLLSAAGASVGVAYRNLQGLQVRLGPLPPAFAHQAVQVPITLSTSGNRPRYAIGLAFLPQPTDRPLAFSDVADSTPMALSFTPGARGWQPLPRVLLQSHYPLGVFRLWSYWQPHSRLLTYPAPETPCPPLPDAHSPPTAAATAAPHGGQEAQDGVRPYQRGDRVRDIVWKKSAQTLASGNGELVVRSYQGQAAQRLWLDAQATGLLGREAQIARLTAWVLHAHEHHSQWGLHLPSGIRIPPDSGAAHLQRCLHALAVEPG